MPTWDLSGDVRRWRQGVRRFSSRESVGLIGLCWASTEVSGDSGVAAVKVASGEA